MSQVKKVPGKPHSSVWLFSLILIFCGLRWLYTLLDRGYITVSRATVGERNTGSVAEFVIAVTLGVGLFLFGYGIRLWWFSRKALRGPHAPTN